MTVQPLSPYETFEPAPIEALAELFLTPVVYPTPVGTRLPNPDDDEDTVSGFVRIEAAGGPPVDEARYEHMLIIFSYHPDETEAEKLIARAVGAAGNALGWHALVEGDRYDVSASRVISVGVRNTDPQVNLPRYRSLVGWTIQGKPI